MSRRKASSPAVVNPARTAIQLAPAAVITEFVDSFFYSFSDKEYAAFAAMLLMVFSFAQNLYEVKTNKALLKPEPA